jgi:signal transduction histidine kinase
MLEDHHSVNLSAEAYDLFKARASVDTLIEQYVSRLVNNREALSAHAGVLEAIFESIGEAITVFDRAGKILLVNRATVDLFKTDASSKTRAEFMGRYSIFAEDGITRVPEGQTPFDIAMREGRTVRTENLMIGPNLPPEGIWVRLSNAPIKSKTGDIIGSVLTLSNISERKRLERQRNALATLITHDIKNHLAAQDITFEMLSTDLAGTLDPSFQGIVGDLQVQNRKFLDIADTLMELYRTDLQEMEFCRVAISVNDILQAAVTVSAMQAKSAGVNVILDVSKDSPTVLGIPAALRQSFHNLIQNSIEVSQPGTTITINTSATKTKVSISVTDEGPGMSPQQVSRLFDRGRVAADMPTSQRSTGFGLYLSRLIVESHGGSMYCQSELGKGTTLTVELPISSV